MNTILDSTEYKTLHKLLVTATADEDGVVSNREEIDRAVVRCKCFLCYDLRNGQVILRMPYCCWLKHNNTMESWGL